MRFRKVGYLVAAVVVSTIPYIVQADDPSVSDLTTSSSSTSSSTSSDKYLNFDPSKNFIGTGTDKVADATGSIKRITFLAGGKDPVSITINIVNVALGVLGLASLIMMLYAGVLWFGAQDNEEQITKAKDVMIGAVIGLVLTLLAFGLGQLLFDQLYTITGEVAS